MIAIPRSHCVTVISAARSALWRSVAARPRRVLLDRAWACPRGSFGSALWPLR
jgi:hypothetical protein